MISQRSWHDDWAGLHVAVLGLGKSGFSVADTLCEPVSYTHLTLPTNREV